MLFDDLKRQQIRKVDFANPATPIEPVNFSTLERRIAGETEPEGLEEVSTFLPEFDEQEAQFDVELARREGYDQGVADTHALWEARVAQQAEASDVALKRALSEVQAFAEDLTTQSQRIVLELARVFAENILERELVLPETVVDVTRAAVRRACGLGQIHIYVDPDSVEMLTAHARFLRDEDPNGATISIHADERLVRGDVRITSDGGQIDGVMTDRLDRLVGSAFSNISDVFARPVADLSDAIEPPEIEPPEIEPPEGADSDDFKRRRQP